MINLKDKKTQDVINELSNIVKRRSNSMVSKGVSFNTRSKLQNELILSLFNISFSCRKDEIKKEFNLKYDYNLEINEIYSELGKLGLFNDGERRWLLTWAYKFNSIFEKILSGEDKIEELEDMIHKIKEEDKKNKSAFRVAMLMIYYRLPLSVINDNKLVNIESFNSVYLKYTLFDLIDILKISYGTKDKEVESDKLNNKLRLLEEKLNRTEEMLQELQEDFEEQLRESKIIEMTNFFAKLNSEKYGCILDQLIECRDGMSTLKKKKFELPLEINGLFVMTKNLAKFTQDSHIAPIMKPDEIKNVKLSDIEFCQYEGTEFKDEDEIKQIIVISPGWIYRDKEIQISRPKVREVEQND